MNILRGCSILIIGIFLLSNHVQARAWPSHHLSCEEFIDFIDPENLYAKDWLPQETNLQPWTDSFKKDIDAAFCGIQSRAPNFIARACNGKKLKFVLTKSSDPYNMACHPSVIRCYPNFFHDDLNNRQCTLTHELVHAIDTSAVLSDESEWNHLVTPYLQHYRDKCHNFCTCYGAMDPKAVLFGLPTFYAASNTEEALADYTTAYLWTGWSPCAGIERFIQKKMLATFAKPDAQRELLIQAFAEKERRNWKRVIVIHTELLRLKPNCIPSRAGLAEAWAYLDDPEMTEFNASAALRMLQNNGAIYSDGIKFCEGWMAWALAKIGINYSESRLEYKAIGEYNKSLSFVLNFAFAYAQRGRSYYFLKQYKNAIRDYSKALSLGLIEAETYARRGDCFSHLGQYQRAIDDFTKAISLNHHYEWAYSFRSIVYKKLGKYQLAAKDNEMALKLKHKSI